jgi:16S rRNA (guanine527-N7)-methyltransferase
VITCRAFSSLASFVGATDRHRKPDGVWLAMKGKVPHDELKEIAQVVESEVEQIVVPRLASERCLVWLRKRGRLEQRERTLIAKAAPTLAPAAKP